MFEVDIAIVGGGIAGLWTLAELTAAGYSCVLLESDTLGGGQTLASQGIIHGGLKYGLEGGLNAATESIKDMPSVWSEVVAGRGNFPLPNVETLSSQHVMWPSGSLGSYVSQFFASKLVAGRMDKLKRSNYPALFDHPEFAGPLYALNELVLDIPSVVRAFQAEYGQFCLKIAPKSLQVDENNRRVNGLTFKSDGGEVGAVRAQYTVFTAALGNLYAGFLPNVAVQLRPLKMVLVTWHTPAQKVFGHCIGGNKNPLLTITSHENRTGQTIWYLGGELAEQGVDRSNGQQILEARFALERSLPWVDFSECEISCFDIERIEAKQPDGKRPATASFVCGDNAIAAWPTKLALAPTVARRVLNQLNRANIVPTFAAKAIDWPKASVGAAPWERED